MKSTTPSNEQEEVLEGRLRLHREDVDPDTVPEPEETVKKPVRKRKRRTKNT